MLDPELFRFAWSLDHSDRVRDGQTKWPLRKLAARILPAGLVERPKHGFGIPIAAWLRGPLRPWAEDLFDATLLDEQGWFNVSLVRSRWEAHLEDQEDLSAFLWPLLMFQAWLCEVGE